MYLLKERFVFYFIDGCLLNFIIKFIYFDLGYREDFFKGFGMCHL